MLLAREDADDDHYADAVRMLGDEDPLATLDLAFYEVANVAMCAWGDPAAAGRLRERVVAVAEDGGAQLVSCDVRDLISRGLARLPGDASMEDS